MFKSRFAAIAAASICIAFATPVAAQSDWPIDNGDFVEVGMISVDDGHDLEYATFLADRWKAQQEFAKSQGWITSYEVLFNANRRKGEPDIYLLTRFSKMPDSAEELKREKAFLDFIKQTTAQLQAESGDRAKFRTQIGSMLLREGRFKK